MISVYQLKHTSYGSCWMCASIVLWPCVICQCSAHERLNNEVGTSLERPALIAIPPSATFIHSPKLPPTQPIVRHIPIIVYQNTMHFIKRPAVTVLRYSGDSNFLAIRALRSRTATDQWSSIPIPCIKLRSRLELSSITQIEIFSWASYVVCVAIILRRRC